MSCALSISRLRFGLLDQIAYPAIGRATPSRKYRNFSSRLEESLMMLPPLTHIEKESVSRGSGLEHRIGARNFGCMNICLTEAISKPSAVQLHGPAQMRDTRAHSARRHCDSRDHAHDEAWSDIRCLPTLPTCHSLFLRD
jgi:hypothetical protein